jgi:hypothetical protein
MNFRVNWPVLDFGARRVFAKIVIAFPILRRPDGSRHKAATAVRTDIVQNGINTIGTKGTFIGTNAGLK